MRISTKGRQAVMAMLDVMRYGNTKPVSLAEVAKRQGISLSYLEQLIARLKKNNLVKSTRGPGGGYMLGAANSHIKIADIVAAVDEPRTRLKIDDPLTADVSQLTNFLWQAVGDRITLFLREVTLADVSNCSLCDEDLLGLQSEDSEPENSAFRAVNE